MNPDKKESPQTKTTQQRREQVLEVLGASGPMTVKQLAAIIDPKYSRIMRSLNEDLAVLSAMGKVVRSRARHGSGTAFIYSLAAETVTAEVVEPKQPKETPAPIEYNGIPEDIRKEFRLDAEGRAFISIRGAARLLGINDSSISAGNFPANLLQTLTQQGFQVLGFSAAGIPDTAFALIAEYYALDAGKWCKEQAKQVYRAFASIGVRLWIQKELNWQKTETQTPAPVVPIVGMGARMDALIAISQNMVEGLSLLHETVKQHDSKIVQLQDYIERQDKFRKQVEGELLNVTPTVPAPPKSDRKSLVGHLNKWSYLTGVKHQTTWHTFYTEVELRCGKSLMAEVKRLKAKGLKDVKKLDAIESLGLLPQAIAIAYEIFQPPGDDYGAAGVPRRPAPTQGPTVGELVPNA